MKNLKSNILAIIKRTQSDNIDLIYSELSRLYGREKVGFNDKEKVVINRRLSLELIKQELNRTSVWWEYSAYLDSLEEKLRANKNIDLFEDYQRLKESC